jgi:hypothetical protein
MTDKLIVQFLDNNSHCLFDSIQRRSRMPLKAETNESEKIWLQYAVEWPELWVIFYLGIGQIFQLVRNYLVQQCKEIKPIVIKCA